MGRWFMMHVFVCIYWETIVRVRLNIQMLGNDEISVQIEKYNERVFMHGKGTCTRVCVFKVNVFKGISYPKEQCPLFLLCCPQLILMISF